MMNMPWRIACTASLMPGPLLCAPRPVVVGTSCQLVPSGLWDKLAACPYGMASCQDLPKRLPSVGDRHRPPAVVVNGHLRVDAQAVIDGGADVPDVDRAVLDVGRVGVGRAVDAAAAQAGAGQEHGVAV